MNYIVYILQTSGNTFYTGITNNLPKRLQRHKSGKGSKYMRRYQSFALVYKELSKDRSTASIREDGIKKLSREKKVELITFF